VADLRGREVKIYRLEIFSSFLKNYFQKETNLLKFPTYKLPDYDNSSVSFALNDYKDDILCVWKLRMVRAGQLFQNELKSNPIDDIELSFCASKSR